MLLTTIAWSVAQPDRRVWPPPGRRSWQYAPTWIGWTNSTGVKDGFSPSGPYRFTRNPQYVGDTVLFLGLSIIANSQLLWITHALLALWFIIAPLSEEVWLKETRLLRPARSAER